ncbi:MAG: pyridoxamine 5'-phosphate oxidase family protein [Elusimicrobia bacterium]|nr:pyridoxamine 5'-phosphate oxidase family protein [Elusimicrobiota bacterium]
MSEKCKKAMTKEEINKFLSEEDTGYLAMCSESIPYCVPVSYAFIDGKIMFHGALIGKKMDFLRKNPNVCFSVSRHPDKIKPHHTENWRSYRCESVICLGKAKIVEDLDEKYLKLSKFLSYFNARLEKPDEIPITKEVAEKILCVEIEIENSTGKRKI